MTVVAADLQRNSLGLIPCDSLSPSRRPSGVAFISLRTKPCGAIPDWYNRIKGAVAFIDEHYSEKLALRQLAESSGLSQTLFSRLFKKTMQTTPIRYITEIRLNAARKLLSGTGKTLADIAAETGFYDEAHFVRTFKRSRGLTPGDYRRQHRTSAR